jgi:hypothetical protein
MSYRSLLKQRCRIQRLTEVNFDGLVSNEWNVVDGTENTRCFLDLNFIRAGKDPVWTPDTGMAQDRAGVLFLAPGALAMPGDRVEMIKGPQGTFEIMSSMDEAWTPRKLHHLECYVKEVARAFVAGGN